MMLYRMLYRISASSNPNLAKTAYDGILHISATCCNMMCQFSNARKQLQSTC